MNCKTLCVGKKPQEYNKLFFGDFGNYLRLDYVTNENFKKLAENSESNVWFTNEIEYSRDRKGYDKLSEKEKRMFHVNILYQNLLDSLVPNIFGVLSELATDTYLSYLYSRINTEENIHAMTYSSGLMQVFGSDATEMLDLVYEDEILQNRMNADVEAANTFVDLAKNSEVDDDLKKALIVSLIRTYYLEGVRFPASFFVTWTINKNNSGAIQGFSQALKLILWDELTVHTTTGMNVIKTLYRDRSQGFWHLREFIKEQLYTIGEEVYRSEVQWAEYLLRDGEISGYNLSIAKHFIRYQIDLRLKNLKFNPVYNEKKSDLIDWFDDYRNLNKTQTALQEADNLNYKKGALKNDLSLLDKENI